MREVHEPELTNAPYMHQLALNLKPALQVGRASETESSPPVQLYSTDHTLRAARWLPIDPEQ
jgi:hypothetical protein